MLTCKTWPFYKNKNKSRGGGGGGEKKKKKNRVLPVEFNLMQAAGHLGDNLLAKSMHSFEHSDILSIGQ